MAHQLRSVPFGCSLQTAQLRTKQSRERERENRTNDRAARLELKGVTVGFDCCIATRVPFFRSLLK
jgi:hypothetical protein